MGFKQIENAFHIGAGPPAVGARKIKDAQFVRAANRLPALLAFWDNSKLA
jgi:hypothetical protein